jgi:hypothetical protein
VGVVGVCECVCVWCTYLIQYAEGILKLERMQQI